MMTTTARTPTTRTPGCRKEEDDGAEEEAQKTSRSDVEEREGRRRTDEEVWDSEYSPEYIHSQKSSPLKKDGAAVESDREMGG